MIFVDTGAWFALAVSEDPMHDRANRWLDGNIDRLLTNDYIIDELLTLLKMRGHFQRALVIGEELWKGDLARIERASERIFRRLGQRFVASMTRDGASPIVSQGQ